MNTFDYTEIEEAYHRLKTYVYYDNAEILLRRQLVEFETNTSKSLNSILGNYSQPYYTKVGLNLDKSSSEIVKYKLKQLTEALNFYSDKPAFFDHLITQVTIHFYPKKHHEDEAVENFVTNKRQKDSYPLDRVTAFINAPIELHILSVLWIMNFGVALDEKLSPNCYGNRLLLNKDKDKKNLIKGSGLFKPYFKQYQKWRDKSVQRAQELLQDDTNVLFLNLDVKDYFHSVRIDNSIFIDPAFPNAKGSLHNLKAILVKIHHTYTEQVSSTYQIPYDFKDELKRENGILQEFILPIGLLSSYVLANHYLEKFDERMIQKYKPAYYGRYVDDILLVIADPNLDYNETEKNEDFKFDFTKYKQYVEADETKSKTITFEEKEISKIERYILNNFSPLILLVDSPFASKKKERIFAINGYPSLYCQSDKTLMHYFDSDESDLVIDKLKQELNERSSEFRDLPTNEESIGDFEKSAYHLHYTGHEGKIRTLKDYEENKYGLTIYLTNQIFSALRHERKVSEKEKNQILKFFKGENCLKFYRLWERILTFFIVNDEPKAYVDFLFHCARQINNIHDEEHEVIPSTKVKYSAVRETLIEYLDCAHELTMSLSPKFIFKTKEIQDHFEMNKNKLQGFSFLYEDHELTSLKSHWFKRFRETNMVRQQYVVTPLLSYTKASKLSEISLISPKIDISKYELDMELIENSPRPLKFWECSMATVFKRLTAFDSQSSEHTDEYFYTDVLGTRLSEQEQDKQKSFSYYLDNAFDLYLIGNSHHFPEYLRLEDSLRNSFYELKPSDENSGKIDLKELRINSKKDKKITQPKIAFANIAVDEKNIIAGLRGTPNVSIDRYQKFASILNDARKEKSDIIIFPEFFIPMNLLSSLVRFSEKNGTMVVTGLEHITVDKTSFNFVVTTLPIEVNGITDAVVVFRLKNNYAHLEEQFISGNHFNIPKPKPYSYDLINWRNIYFSVFYCFELANVEHRSLLKGRIDLLIATEWNKDTPYFSNIVESCSRDLHCYVAQVNTSQFGDTRLTQPSESARKDLLRLKGGINDSILIGQIDLPKLREFQRKKYGLTHTDKTFKPLPPDFSLEQVVARIKNDFTGNKNHDS